MQDHNYILGYRSFWRGLDVNECPFVPTTAFELAGYEQWIAGWNDAKASWEDREH